MQGKRTMKNLVLTATAVAIMLIGCTSNKNYHSDVGNISMTPTIGEVPKRVELEQSWDEKTRLNFWFTSQGSRIIPYTWFTWLELADSQQYFRSTKHMELLRYLPEKTSARNPAGLPIGFALDQDKKTGEAWMGMTCAACHTNQLNYKEAKILIEGAPTLGNFVLFYSRLVDALNATNQNNAKFDRFAQKVLANDYTAQSAQQLHERLKVVALKASERQEVNALPAGYAKDFTSYARLDAFGNIQNAGSAFALHDLANANAPTAPVSYPFLWGTHQSDVVQWNASAPNTPVIGPLVRNIGEVVGVFGGLEIKEATFWQQMFGKKTRYSSNVDIKALGALESWVRDLRSPVWPQQYLPTINAVKAAQGAVLYAKACANCHQVIPRTQEGNKYISVKTPVATLGTDPETAWNADFHMANSLILEGEKTKILLGERFEKNTAAINIPANGVVGIVLKDPITALKAGLRPLKQNEKSSGNDDEERSFEQLMAAHLKKIQAMSQAKKTEKKARTSSAKSSGRNFDNLVYKARPLNGIWATAPFMHNGSVPNLWELLKKPAQRTNQFWVGSRDFDPVKIGFKTNTGLSMFKVLDNNGRIQPGNSNLGHSYGTDLSDKQKWSLLEYMKTI